MIADLRRVVHVVKPEKSTYAHDPRHRPDWKTKTTRNSRKVETSRGYKVQCKLNCVSPHMQGILAFMCTYWLEQQPISSDGATCQHPLITFMKELLEHCAFGVLHTAKSDRHYAQLMDMNSEHVSGWFNTYNSKYILLTKDARYASFQALLRLLRNPSDLDGYTETVLEDIVDGFVCLCALPDSKFGGCFAQYNSQDKDAFFLHLVNNIEKVVGELWRGKSNERVQTYNSGLRGTGRSCYFNILECYFPD